VAAAKNRDAPEEGFAFLRRYDADPRPVYVVRPEGLDTFLSQLPAPQAAYLRAGGFAAKVGELTLLPGDDGVSAAVLGVGDDRSFQPFGVLPFRLPLGRAWRLADGDYDGGAAALGYALGAYRYSAFKPSEREAAAFVPPDGSQSSLAEAAAIGEVRDLINTPANLLGPAELADAACALAARYGAAATRLTGDDLSRAYPTIAAVGAGAARAPHTVMFSWKGSDAGGDAPFVSLCGKGVCFDTGGYDLKPSSGMLRMKKDMAGAAVALGIARVVMAADLPIRLAVRIGCVENSISGTAMRPLDVIRTRRGLTVEIGNTDAEGRLVLCDLLAEASDDGPDMLLDFATLTGAARAALGPDVPALFANDDGLAESLLDAATQAGDPLWRLPLWKPYDAWLASPTADLNNVATQPLAGAIVAALFLQRFIVPGVKWGHVDLYGWNDKASPGCPEGGEAQGLRAVVAALRRLCNR